LQAQVEAAQEVQHVKEAMARQAQMEAADLKKKQEDAEQKAMMRPGQRLQQILSIFNIHTR
jgi:hypothetical protein